MMASMSSRRSRSSVGASGGPGGGGGGRGGGRGVPPELGLLKKERAVHSTLAQKQSVSEGGRWMLHTTHNRRPQHNNITNTTTADTPTTISPLGVPIRNIFGSSFGTPANSSVFGTTFGTTAPTDSNPSKPTLIPVFGAPSSNPK